jgi:acyl-CoA synthetase (NDP forming)
MIAASDRQWIQSALPHLLRPASVAIVGASATPGSFGESILTNLDRAKYRGDLYLINPKRSEIHGKPCLPSIEDLPPGVDCAVLAIPRASVASAVAACAQRQVRSVIIFSAGFAETGESGRAEQDALAALAGTHGMLIEGPNCLGLVNAIHGIPLTFVATLPDNRPHTSRVAILSQSGAMAAVVGTTLDTRALGMSFSVSTGNEAVTGIEDYLEYLVDDSNTQVVVMIVEHFRRPRHFLESAQRAAKLSKRIVLLHPGRSSEARESAATHTGAMAGDYEVMRTMVEHAGVLVVDTIEELVDVAELLVRCPPISHRGVAVLTESGAFKALTLDLCSTLGLPLPALTEETHRRLQEALPDFVPPSNPLDITAQALVDPGLYERTLPLMAADERYGSLVLAIITTDDSTVALKQQPILNAIGELARQKPILFTALDEMENTPGSLIEHLHALGVPFFKSPARVFQALAHLIAARKPSVDLTTTNLPPLIGNALLSESGALTEYKSKLILRSAGIPVPDGHVARTLEEALAIASRIGYPVALKAQAKELTHKTDRGGVALNISSHDELADAWHKVLENTSGLILDGILTEKMATPGAELIIGGRAESDWGPTLLVGFGGILAEVLEDVRLLPATLNAAQIEDELLNLKCAPILRGFRGSPALDTRAVAEITAKVGALMLANPSIREIDINPVIVYPEGHGAIAVDALALNRW